MLIAIIGTYNDQKLGSIRGNGKTLSAVYLAYNSYEEGKKVYTNFYTTFGEMVTLNQLVLLFKNKKLNNTVVILDEAQVYLMNSGVKAKTLKEIINLFIAQTRKQNVDIILTTQRYKNLHVQLRTQVDELIIPVKYHLKNNKLTTVCNNDSCKKPHAICMLNLNSNEFLPYILNPIIVGKLYDSNEIVFDEFILEKEGIK